MPGSLSSALMIRYDGLTVVFGINDHLVPVENPAPPSDLFSPDVFTSL